MGFMGLVVFVGFRGDGRGGGSGSGLILFCRVSGGRAGGVSFGLAGSSTGLTVSISSGFRV